MSTQNRDGHHFAELAKIAYMTEEQSKPIAESMGYSHIKLIDRKGAECLVCENDKDIVLAFRGTEPKEFSDIKADLKAWKRHSQTQGMVHAGFYDYLERIWADVKTHVDAVENKDLYICGHSLGGAMATLAASRFAYRVRCCYTYGSPRVGGRDWNRKQAWSHHRYVNNNDIVPRVPFWIMGFRHYGVLHYINYYGNIRPMTPWQRFKDGWRGRYRALRKLQPFDGAFDHSVNLYCDKTKSP